MNVNWSLALIPVIAGAIGYITNFVAIRLLFFPVHHVGFEVPGLATFASVLPRKLQAIPGLLRGRVGWQGIIPSRAAKMGSIAVDKGIAKLGTPSEFYEQLEPERIAEHILASAREDIRDLVESILEREHPQLWRDTPRAIRDAVHDRVQSQLPRIVHEVTEELGRNIDQLLDVKLMVIEKIEANPALANKIFLEVGRKELNFVINSGLYLGFLLGLPTVPIFARYGYWWILPIAGVLVGYLTNWIAVKVIFLPVEPVRIGPFRLQGLFMKRQHEVADVYSRVIAEDIVNLVNIGEQLLTGPRSDRTRKMIEDALRPAIDQSLGPAHGAVRVAVGTREYDAIRQSVATEAVDYTMTPLTDPAFNEQQSKRIYDLLVGRMRNLPPDDFAELLRAAMREDEWMLLALGSVLGFCAGLLQLLTV